MLQIALMLITCLIFPEFVFLILKFPLSREFVMSQKISLTKKAEAALKDDVFTVLELNNGSKVHYRLKIRFIAKKLDISLFQIARGAGITPALMYFITSEDSSRVPRLDTIIKILYAINSLSPKKKYRLEDLIEIE